MTPDEKRQLERLTAEYVKPALDRLYEMVISGKPMTHVEIGIWNMAAGPELQIRALSAMTPPVTGPGADYANAPKITDGQ